MLSCLISSFSLWSVSNNLGNKFLCKTFWHNAPFFTWNSPDHKMGPWIYCLTHKFQIYFIKEALFLTIHLFIFKIVAHIATILYRRILQNVAFCYLNAIGTPLNEIVLFEFLFERFTEISGKIKIFGQYECQSSTILNTVCPCITSWHMLLCVLSTIMWYKNPSKSSLKSLVLKRIFEKLDIEASIW